MPSPFTFSQPPDLLQLLDRCRMKFSCAIRADADLEISAFCYRVEQVADDPACAFIFRRIGIIREAEAKG